MRKRSKHDLDKRSYLSQKYIRKIYNIHEEVLIKLLTRFRIGFSHLHEHTNFEITLRALKTHWEAYFTCDSSNLLYVVVCPVCGKEYTGDTGTSKTKLIYIRSGNLSIKNSRWKKNLERVVKVLLKSFLYFRYEALSFTYKLVAKKTSGKNRKQN